MFLICVYVCVLFVLFFVLLFFFLQSSDVWISGFSCGFFSFLEDKKKNTHHTHIRQNPGVKIHFFVCLRERFYFSCHWKMGSGASTKLDLSIIENLDNEFEKHGDAAVRLAWELTAKQLSSNSDLEMHLCQLRRLANTLIKDPWSSENKQRRYVFRIRSSFYRHAHAFYRPSQKMARRRNE